MIKEIHLENLLDLKNKVNEIYLTVKESRSHDYQLISEPIFRGQSSSNWSLQTTLERYVGGAYSQKKYEKLLYKFWCAVNSFTDKRWDFKTGTTSKAGSDLFFDIGNYEFLVYARHHGFPSPLLDWTKSLYVALYFAFADCNEKSGEKVAIFSYIESLKGGMKTGWVGNAKIDLLGPYVSTHKRHFMQQAQYTCAIKPEENQWTYVSHEDVLASQGNSDQDVIYKLLLPSSIKLDVMRELSKMNINAFTLFGTEEALARDIAYREIVLGELDGK